MVTNEEKIRAAFMIATASFWFMVIWVVLSWVTKPSATSAELSPTTENEWTRYIVNQYEYLNGGLINQPLEDGTRPDIQLSNQVIEVDWANKWAEGVGQSLYYSKVTGKRPVLLLMTRGGRDSELDKRYIQRALVVITSSQGDVWWYNCNSRKWLRRE